jgi:hypothetical protein
MPSYQVWEADFRWFFICKIPYLLSWVSQAGPNKVHLPDAFFFDLLHPATRWKRTWQ